MRVVVLSISSFVFQHAPKDKLLVFRSQDGWKPLCEFLGKEIPQQPYPWRNKGGEEVLAMIEQHPYGIRVKNESFAIISAIIALFTLLCYWLFRLCI